jgi:hypothetical protein
LATQDPGGRFPPGGFGGGGGAAGNRRLYPARDRTFGARCIAAFSLCMVILFTGERYETKPKIEIIVSSRLS